MHVVDRSAGSRRAASRSASPWGRAGGSGGRSCARSSVPFSPARPSRLKNEPGILPAAYMRSSTSTVSGRKSTSRRLPAVAVHEHHRVALADDDGAGGLLGHLAGLEGDLRCRRSRRRPWSRRQYSYVVPSVRVRPSDRRAQLASFVSYPNPIIVAASSRAAARHRASSADPAPVAPAGERVGVVATPARSARDVARTRRRPPRRGGRPRSARGRARARSQRAHSAGRRCGPGRRTARRGTPRTRPGAAAASAAWASGDARADAWRAARSGGRRRAAALRAGARRRRAQRGQVKSA